ERISGLKGALVPVSNTDCDRHLLEDRIAEAADGRAGVLFTDMSTGSCMIAALTRARERNDLRVVTGVNLAMLLDFVFHREAPPEEAAERAVSVGAKAIRKS
ncbi:MAG: PTS sugar transporter subunit IIA, partial [Gemmatimonadales bacterium]